MTYTRRKVRTGPNWKLWIPIIAAVITAIATIIAAIIKPPFLGFDKGTPTPSSTPTSIAATVVKFGNVKDGDRIVVATEGDWPIEPHGTHARVPEDKEIWLVAWQGSTCYPMDGPAVKEAKGTWKHGPLTFIRSDQYKLSTVLADAGASALLKAAVGHSEGLPCLPAGAEFIESISVQVLISAATVPPTSTPEAKVTPTETPSSGFVAVGKVCEAEEGSDTNTIFLRQAEFNTLGLQRRAKVNILVQDTGGRANNVTLEMDPDLADCVAKLPRTLRAPLKVMDDTSLTVDKRPEHHFAIVEVQIEIAITSLKAGTKVGREVPSVAGTYVGIPADRDLWLVVFVGNNYFPQTKPATLVPDVREWEYGTVYFGEPDSPPGDYTLLAVLADSDASEEFWKHFDGSAIHGELPVGAIIYDRVKVTRDR